jgi:hypothetical protein
MHWIIKMTRQLRLGCQLQDAAALPSSSRSSTTLSGLSGRFSINESGVTAQLQPPLSRLSGHYPWNYFPMSLAAMKLLVVDDGCSDIAEVLLDNSERRQLAEKIGPVMWTVGPNGINEMVHDSDYCDDVDRLIRWGAGLAALCPNPAAARALRKIPHMRAVDLDQYVKSWIS